MKTADEGQIVDPEQQFTGTTRPGRAPRLLPPSMRELARGTIPLLLALGLLNASNYIFHVAVSRLLGPSEYGALAALLAVVIVLSVPLSVAQTVVAKRTAKLRVEGRDGEIDATMVGTAKALAVFGVAGLVVLAAVSPLLAIFLRTEAGPAALLGPYWLLSILLSAPLGLLQGRLRFGTLGGVALVGVAVRLGAGIGLVWAGFGVAGAMLGTVLGQAASLALAAPLVGLSRRAWKAGRASLATLRGEFGPTLLALVSFWLLAEIDVVLARRYLEGAEAGFYASAGLLARALLFLPAAISIVALPRFAEARDGEDARRRLRLALAGVGGLVLLAYPVLVLMQEPAVSIAFGEEFAPAATLLPLLAAGMGLLAITNLLVFFHIAEGTKAYRLVFASVITETVLIAFFHNSGHQIGWVVLGVSGATAILMYHAAVAACRWRPQPVAIGGASDPGLNGHATVDLSVVLPCHNAGRGLRSTLSSLRDHLRHADSWEIIVVSDGSTDDTVSIATEFASERIHLVHEPIQIGKGHALRTGLALARGRYVAFVDGDGDIDPAVIGPAMALMRLYEPDIILGSKRHPLSEVRYPPVRRLLSWLYHKLCRVLFRINVRDTQTGFKLIRREVLADVLPRMLEKRYAFDLEFLVVARQLGYHRVFETPIRLDFRFDSQIAARAALRILQDTLAVFYRRFILNTYWQPGAEGHSRARPMRNGSLRILFLNWRDIRNPDAGGAEVVTHEVAKRWVQAGHQVSLLTSGFKGAPRVETIDGVRITRKGRLRRGTYHLLVQWQLARLRGYDVVIDEVNTIPFLTPAWRHRLPTTVALIHQLAADVWDAELPRPFAAVGKKLEPYLLRLYADSPVITGSESTERDLIRLGVKKVAVVPYGRDEPSDVEEVPKEPVPTFLFVGRLTRNKRPDHAVRAFNLIREQIPDARLWIIGEGPMEDDLRRSLPPRAEILSRVPRHELYRRMASAHVLLVPSVREGWGLVVTEANSVGTPAVGYDVPGVRDSIRDRETGFLARAGNPEGLARMAISLVRDKDSYTQTVERARLWARRFSWDRTQAGLMAVILNHSSVLDKDDSGPISRDQPIRTG